MSVEHRQPNPENDRAQQLVEKLKKIELADGSTLEQELKKQERKIQRTDKPVFIFDVIVSDPSAYNELVNLVAEYFHARATDESHHVGAAQYDELVEFLVHAQGFTIVRDTQTFGQIPHAGWIHSQDQAIKSGPVNEALQNASKQNANAKLLLMRFCNTSDQNQRLHASDLNDFVDAQIQLVM